MSLHLRACFFREAGATDQPLPWMKLRLHPGACFFREFCEGEKRSLGCLRSQTSLKPGCDILLSDSKRHHTAQKETEEKCMKRILCAVLVLTLLLTAVPVLAQSIEDLDWTAMTDV